MTILYMTFHQETFMLIKFRSIQKLFFEYERHEKQKNNIPIKILFIYMKSNTKKLMELFFYLQKLSKSKKSIEKIFTNKQKQKIYLDPKNAIFR